MKHFPTNLLPPAPISYLTEIFQNIYNSQVHWRLYRIHLLVKKLKNDPTRTEVARHIGNFIQGKQIIEKSFVLAASGCRIKEMKQKVVKSGEKLEDIGVRCGRGTKTNSVDGIMFKILWKRTPSTNSKITVLHFKPFKSTQARLLNTDTGIVE